MELPAKVAAVTRELDDLDRVSYSRPLRQTCASIAASFPVFEPLKASQWLLHVHVAATVWFDMCAGDTGRASRRGQVAR